ncbi:hypothetical protein DPMN_060628 [Dreissena polymorpha]|uniref:Uncharacterized protein n=1 Tax=Dreissena polymorpha TaxID=45954 RepID=A0A9D4C625_DREPO|nr:hypothetical protein DPMN_060628 [Dreissena polymorpha]
MAATENLRTLTPAGKVSTLVAPKKSWSPLMMMYCIDCSRRSPKSRTTVNSFGVAPSYGMEKVTDFGFSYYYSQSLNELG